MKRFLGSRLVSIAALTLYVVVYVGAGALHHHHGVDGRTERFPAAAYTGFQFLASDPADEDDAEDCLLCSVLHLAQTLPATVHVESVTTFAGNAFSPVPLLPPHPFKTARRARSPPMA